MKKQYVLNTLLAGVMFAALATMLVVRVIVPAAVLPKIDIPNMVLVSLIALLLDAYIAPRAERCYICVVLLGFVTFALLPLMAGFACQHTFWKYGLIGCAVFTVVTFLFTSIRERLQSGPKAHAALALSAVGMYLASQIFAGML